MQTSRHYYDDCYTSLFKAEIVDLRPPGDTAPQWQAILNGTYFYPASGGQPCDFGTIGGVPVTDVSEQDDVIIHTLDGPPSGELRLGSTVDCYLDWPRRYDHMQQHTGQHLLSAVFMELLSWKTLSFHMGEHVSSIELATAVIEDAQIEAVEKRANHLVWEVRPIRFHYEDAAATTGLRKPSGRTGTLRIVNISAYDRSACGGTHVRNTAEIGAIQIRNLERVRGNVRVEFVCGGRTLRQSKADFRLLSRLARTASVPPAALENHLTGLRARLDAAEKDLARATLHLAQAEADRLYAETPASPDGLRRWTVRAPGLTEAHRATAVAFAQNSKAVAAFLPESLPGTVLLVCSADSERHAGNLWKAAFASGGGRGGGSATLAQGSVTDAAALENLLRSSGFPQPQKEEEP